MIDALDKFSKGLSLISGIALGCVALLIVLEIILRNLFGISLHFLWEIGVFVHMGAVLLGLMGIGLISLEIFRSIPVEKLLSQAVWNGLSSPELLAFPLFIMMAELLYRSRFIDGLFEALEPWLRYLPGGLLHINIVGCTLFALISGSSAATTSSVGRITINELRDRGYDEQLTYGTLAGAGTLGFFDPAKHRYDHLRRVISNLRFEALRSEPCPWGALSCMFHGLCNDPNDTSAREVW
jgi:TRAP-type uncharacterized transport system fused permease subunit